MEKQSKFQQALQVNVNEKTEKKNGLTYLAWSWAWSEFKKIYEEATYKVKMFDDKPFSYDENLGYMVFTEVTAGGITHEMWLPVMDGANKAMKKVGYKYTTKYGEKSVEPASMFDVNKALMRCLVKNLAMFGLGLYIYAGEDLPEEPVSEPEPPVEVTLEALTALMEEKGTDKKKLLDYFQVDALEKLGHKDIEKAINQINK